MYEGHLINSGGLQGHSIGDHYPLIIIGRKVGYQAINAATSREYKIHLTYAAALDEGLEFERFLCEQQR